MAEWSQLPEELLHLISTLLPGEIDVVRYRSVCTTWRAAVPPHPSASLSRFPILPNEGMCVLSWGFFLSKRPVYYIAAGDHSNGWIIKLERENPDRMRLLHPLTRSGQPLPENFPKPFDFSNLHVVELGFEYTLQYIKYRPLASSIGDAGNMYLEKVAFCYDDTNGEKFTLLTIHISGKLVMYKSGGAKWTVINDLPCPYDDVIFHDGDFYAVDSSGRTVVVDRNSAVPSVREVAGSVFGGDKKHLVGCNGGLLLVDLYLTVGPGGEYFGEVEDLPPLEYGVITERAEKFKVFRLEKNAGRWEEVSSLEDKMVFLGDNVAFTVPVSDFKFGEFKGNCIVFHDFFFGREEDNNEVVRQREILVFDLANGSIAPITTYQGYPELFWPPPSWVYPAGAPSVEVQLEQLGI